MVAHRWVGVSCGSLVGGLGDTLPYAKMLTDCEVLGDGVRGVSSHLRVGCVCRLVCMLGGFVGSCD